jgi:lantibiotic modifying enzyme
MIDQLLLSKRFFQQGELFSQGNDPISTGIAISFFQDSVELLVWLIIKEFSIDVKETESFTSLLDKVEKDLTQRGKSLLHKAKILELNKARVNFKHYGNLPASSESEKFRAYTESYLRTAFEVCFDMNFDVSAQ